MSKPWQNNMLKNTTYTTYGNTDFDMVNSYIERYGESSYELGRADEKNRIEDKVAEWFGRSQDGWIPCQQVIDFCEEIETEEIKEQ